MDVDEPAAAGAAATDPGTEHTHLCHCGHETSCKVSASVTMRNFPVRLPAVNSQVQLTADSNVFSGLHKLARLTSAVVDYCHHKCVCKSKHPSAM